MYIKKREQLTVLVIIALQPGVIKKVYVFNEWRMRNLSLDVMLLFLLVAPFFNCYHTILMTCGNHIAA